MRLCFLQREKQSQFSPLSGRGYVLAHETHEPQWYPLSCSFKGKKLWARNQLASSTSRSQAPGTNSFIPSSAYKQHLVQGSCPNWVQPVIICPPESRESPPFVSIQSKVIGDDWPKEWGGGSDVETTFIPLRHWSACNKNSFYMTEYGVSYTTVNGLCGLT